MKTFKIAVLSIAGVLLGFYAAHCQNFTVLTPNGYTVGHQSPNGNTWAIGSDGSVVTSNNSWGNTVIMNTGPGSQALQDTQTFWNSQERHNLNDPWPVESGEDE